LDPQKLLLCRVFKKFAITVAERIPLDFSTHISGKEDVLPHAVFGFAPFDEENVSVILDLSSMQFGEAGRGLKSGDTFVLESLDHYYDRLETIARGVGESTTSKSLGPTPVDEWLKEVAKRAKSRWSARATQPWCRHCGAPVQLLKPKRCSLCKEVYYCSRAHGKLHGHSTRFFALLEKEITPSAMELRRCITLPSVTVRKQRYIMLQFGGIVGSCLHSCQHQHDIFILH
jgi:hypothetical protein